ncbi:MAG: hypothetical protein M1816_008027 [Peltula sp. TS41687]|nr:MAG: hypothetical protein M1816_008027 [Peltula sp. TS41687]
MSTSNMATPSIRSAGHSTKLTSTPGKTHQRTRSSPGAIQRIPLLDDTGIILTYILDAFHAFPPPVAAKLRRALWYANQDVNPAEAMKYYKQTLEVADEVGMDSLGDEILGVKISLAAFLERLQIYPKAIEVLELVRRDCLAWIEQRGGLQGNEAKRTRLLAKAIAIAVKQGELYANRYVGEKEAAEECLVWAVEAALRERRRRDQLGVKDGEAEGEWMTDEQIGAALEALANHFEEKDLHYLAAPLYLQAIAMIPWSNCHAAILMNNLSASLVQQTPPPYEGGPPPATRSELINSARSWALKAIEVSHRIKRLDGRTEECDVGCAVATHNLGEFEEMHGNIAEARRRYQEAKGLAKAVGFKEGIENADKGLERLRGKE